MDDSETFLDGGKIPCVLIENKIDLLDDPIEGEEEFTQFAKNADFCGCFRTSAKLGKNIIESMEFLIRLIIKRMNDMKDKNIENEHARETIKLDRQSANKNASKPKKCC